MTKYKISADAVAQLQTALDYLTEHPEEHNQGVYVRQTPCGTSCCMAGRILLNNPDKFRLLFDDDYDLVTVEGLTAELEEDYSADEAVAALLGIPQEFSRYMSPDDEWQTEPPTTFEQLECMFSGNRTIGQLWSLGQDLCEGRLVMPERYQEETA